MKRRFLLFAAVLLCVTLPLSAMAEFAFVQLGTDLYAEADAASTVLSSYRAGTWVEVAQGDGLAEDAAFVNVIGPDGLSGYVPDTDVFILSQTPQDQVTVVANNGKYVNLRAEASKKSASLAKVNSGTPMTLIETGKTFDRVRIANLEGYMVAGMVKTGLKPIASPLVEAANGKGVNLRSEPTMNGDVLASIPYGGTVGVYMLGGGWAYVRYGGINGYVMSKFLTSAAPAPTPGPGPTYGPVPNPDPDSDFWEVNMTCYVSNGGASVRYRSGPGGSARVLGKLASGTEVFVMSTNGSWSKITFGAGGKAAYMMSRYLVTVMPDPDPYDPYDPTDPIVDPVIYDDDPSYDLAE